MPDNALTRPDYALADSLWADSGAVFITGTQGFISGYRGSPLGMVDQAVWKAGARFTEQGNRFVPASGATVDLDAINTEVAGWHDAAAVARLRG